MLRLVLAMIVLNICGWILLEGTPTEYRTELWRGIRKWLYIFTGACVVISGIGLVFSIFYN